MQAVEVRAVEIYPEYRFCLRLDKVALLGTDHAGKNRRFRVAVDALLSSHNSCPCNDLLCKQAHSSEKIGTWQPERIVRQAHRSLLKLGSAAGWVPRANRRQRPVYVGQNPINGTYRRNYEGDYL